jgi:predicted neuraminidase
MIQQVINTLRHLHRLIYSILLLGFFGISANSYAQVPDNSSVSKEFIFKDNKEFKKCHASTLVRLNDGKFIVAWFGGTKEGNDDVGIWMSKGTPGQWSSPFPVAKIRPDAHWNPVLFQSPQGKIYLFFKVGKTIPAWETWVKTSDDQGNTWSEAIELVPGDKGGRGPVRNKPIVLSNGAWIAGASFENKEETLWDVFVDRSEDNGKSWIASTYLSLNREKIKGNGVIQPTIWESKPGVVHMLVRSTGGTICRSDSKDYGKTWSELYEIVLPNPNSGIDLAKLPDGTLALLYNPDEKNWGSRGTLNLAISYDNGKNWVKKITIEKGEPKDEFSYPAIIAFGDTVAFTYTYKRENIVFGTMSGVKSK